MSASVATREFLTHINPKEGREIYFPTLLPAMCLNRYGTTTLNYRIAGKFGGDFNLAVWRIVRTSPNLNSRQI